MAFEKKKLARHLRSNMSLPKVLIWTRINRDQIGFQFRRQDPYGPYILDFYCPELCVAIEIDGSVHEGKKVTDEARDSYLIAHGVHVLRFSARSVLKNPNSVVAQVKSYLEELRASQ